MKYIFATIIFFSANAYAQNCDTSIKNYVDAYHISANGESFGSELARCREIGIEKLAQVAVQINDASPTVTERAKMANAVMAYVRERPDAIQHMDAAAIRTFAASLQGDMGFVRKAVGDWIVQNPLYRYDFAQAPSGFFDLVDRIKTQALIVGFKSSLAEGSRLTFGNYPLSINDEAFGGYLADSSITADQFFQGLNSLSDSYTSFEDRVKMLKIASSFMASRQNAIQEVSDGKAIQKFIDFHTTNPEFKIIRNKDGDWMTQSFPYIYARVPTNLIGSMELLRNRAATRLVQESCPSPVRKESGNQAQRYHLLRVPCTDVNCKENHEVAKSQFDK
jgi:hypothetical protein